MSVSIVTIKSKGDGSINLIEKIYRSGVFSSEIITAEYRTKVTEADMLRTILQEQLGDSKILDEYISVIEECNDIEKFQAFSDGVKLGCELAEFMDG